MEGQRKKHMLHLHIPEEIILQILPLLPVKTLMRFRSVCKLWRSLTSDPKFTLSSKGRERALLCCSRGKTEESGRYVVENGNILHSLDHQLSLQQLPNPVGKNFEVKFLWLGSCNGLLLFCASKPLSSCANMHLWNPSTRCLRELNKLYGPIYNSSSFEWPGFGSFGTLSGLCFDHSSDDYKIVLISETSKVHVASLRREIEWKDVSFPCKIPKTAARNQLGVLINGHLHWLAEEQTSFECVIVYFDETRNIFNKLPMPEPLRSRIGTHRDILGLGDLDGCLFLQIYEFSSFDVFIMKEYGVKESWTKVSFLELPAWWILPPLYYTRLGAVLLFRDGCRVVTYNWKDNSSEKIELGQYIFIRDGPFEYVESLASVY